MRSLSIAGLCSCASILLACSDSDTVISLNVNSASSVGFVSRLHVSITQGTRASLERDLTDLPTQVRTIEGAAGATETVIQSTFYERIKLPSSFKDGDTTIDVQAFDRNDRPYQHPDPIVVNIESGEATAAFINLGSASSATGGSGGAGGSAGGNGTAGTAGSVAGATGIPVGGGGSGGSGGVGTAGTAGTTLVMSAGSGG